MYSGKHSQLPAPVQIAFGPQGDGLHGSDAGRSVAMESTYIYIYQYLVYIE